ncbi:hypothetical protein [Texcoconibacillus texcoconensis]|uniref:Uncharacterized protein n=1 Tax=Texcoconibacillus texcoconensis TaxID=1095777 RepID=A0A840QQE9_9BACI|nr:hypothetical protein [Texcoconibacillus texcoconensis]MBB5173662.1 hypothetical protein [Texcoconibacillus texcoconensis]
MKALKMIKGFSILQFLIIIVYFLYLFYIGVFWGWNEPLVLNVISDSIFLFLIPASYGLWNRKVWGWWMTVVIYVQLIFAKGMTFLSIWFMNAFGLNPEPFGAESILIDIIEMFVYIGIVVMFFLHSIRKQFPHKKRFSTLLGRTIAISIFLYIVYFAVMTIGVMEFLLG